jgi:hypothetical protein
VKAGVGTSDWIPSPVQSGAVSPLSHAEVVALYHTNLKVTPADERELNGLRPDVATLPSPVQFSEVLDEIETLKSQDDLYRVELWDCLSSPDQPAQLDSVLALANGAIEFLRDRAPWQLDAIQAGHDGDRAKHVWVSLIQQIEATWLEIQDSHQLVMAHGPRLDVETSPRDSLPCSRRNY